MNQLPDALAKSFSDSPPSFDETLAFDAMNPHVISKGGWQGIFDPATPTRRRNKTFLDLIYSALLLMNESSTLLVLKRLYGVSRDLLELNPLEIAELMFSFRPDKFPELISSLNPNPWALLQLMRYRWSVIGEGESLLDASMDYLETIKFCALEPRPPQFSESIVGDTICALQRIESGKEKSCIIEWLYTNGVDPEILMNHAKAHYLRGIDNGGPRQCEILDAAVALSSFGFIPHQCQVLGYKKFCVSETPDGRLTTCESNYKLIHQFQSCVAKRVSEAIKNPNLENLVMQFVFCNV